VNLGDPEEAVAKAKANRRRIRRSTGGRKCRIDGVSIGRDPMSRSRGRAGYYVYCGLLGEREVTEVSAGSRASGSNWQDRKVEHSIRVIPLDRPLEGYQVLCRRGEGERRRQNHRRRRQADGSSRDSLHIRVNLL
jgi:hypothetical protein